MPRLTLLGPTPNECAICGNAVAMTVVSRYSMKNVAATMYGSQPTCLCGALAALIGRLRAAWAWMLRQACGECGAPGACTLCTLCAM
ncbi:hypothetical protein ABIE53_005901 [Burkholderia sp. OAS925]